MSCNGGCTTEDEDDDDVAGACDCEDSTSVQGGACACARSFGASVFDLTNIIYVNSIDRSDFVVPLPPRIQTLLTGGKQSAQIMIHDDIATGTGIPTGKTFQLVCCGTTIGTSFSNSDEVAGQPQNKKEGEGKPETKPKTDPEECETVPGCPCGLKINGILCNMIVVPYGKTPHEAKKLGIPALSNSIRNTDFGENLAEQGLKGAVDACLEFFSELGNAAGNSLKPAPLLSSGLEILASAWASLIVLLTLVQRPEIYVKLCWDECVKIDHWWCRTRCDWQKKKSGWIVVNPPQGRIQWTLDPGAGGKGWNPISEWDQPNTKNAIKNAMTATINSAFKERGVE
jgi:hypothetical protein